MQQVTYITELYSIEFSYLQAPMQRSSILQVTAKIDNTILVWLNTFMYQLCL